MMAVRTYGQRQREAVRFPRGGGDAVTGSTPSEAVALEAAKATDASGSETLTSEWMSAPVRFALLVLLWIVTFDALHEIFGLADSGAPFYPPSLGTAGSAAGYSNLIDSYFYDLVATGAGILMLVHGLSDRSERGWVLLALGTFSWVVGDILVDLSIGLDLGGAAKGVMASDVFWLAWYPLAAGGLMMLVRARFTDFDFARWVDGIALALVIATPGVALALQPAVDESHGKLLAQIVNIAYPAGDILLLGATIGVIALTGWRPGRSWYLLSLGLSVWVVADAIYVVEKTKGTYVSGVYDYLWPTGLLIMAYAAWQPRSAYSARQLFGWKAVLLPIACQIFALGTQVWGLVSHIGESERIMTIAVLTVVIVQLYLSRPRRHVGVTREPPPRFESAAAPVAGPEHGVPRDGE